MIDTSKIIRIGVSIEEASIAINALGENLRKMRLDLIELDMALMRRRYGPLRYLMPSWWRLNNQLKGMKP